MKNDVYRVEETDMTAARLIKHMLNRPDPIDLDKVEIVSSGVGTHDLIIKARDSASGQAELHSEREHFELRRLPADWVEDPARPFEIWHVMEDHRLEGGKRATFVDKGLSLVDGVTSLREQSKKLKQTYGGPVNGIKHSRFYSEPPQLKALEKLLVRRAAPGGGQQLT